MPDPLRELIHDTLLYLKDPLLPKQTIFAGPEDLLFFKKAEPLPVEKMVVVQPLPPRRPVLVTPPKPLPPSEPPVCAEPPPPVPKASAQKDDFSQIKRTLLRAAPSIHHVDEVPDDATAKRVANSWKEKISDADVILLACERDAETLEFLKSLGKAIDQNLAKAKILPTEKMEAENRWDLFLQKNQFRLIIASDGMRGMPRLMRFYRETPATAEYFLDKTPLLPLSSASLYKSIEHKALLWKTLCRMFGKT